MNLTSPTQHTNESGAAPLSIEEVAVLKVLAQQEMRERVFREVDYQRARQRAEDEESAAGIKQAATS